MFKTKLRTSQVFVPGGFPQITYIPRNEHQLESRVQAAQDNLSKLMVITGATKSGKTVLVDKVFPQDSAIWIDGGTISDEQSFWDSIVEKMELFTYTEVSESYSDSMEAGVEASVEGNALFAKGSAKLHGTLQVGSSDGASYHRNISAKIIAIRALQDNLVPLVVDDFHYISKPIQKSIVRALKAPIMHGLPVIFIAIPNRKYDAVEVEREMTGRIENIEMPIWSEEELKGIAHTGFGKLDVEISANLISELANAAYGSPFLMQEFCKEICLRSGITEQKSSPQHIPDDISVGSIFTTIAEHSGRSMFDKLKRGPRARTDRKPRHMVDGTVTDIYGVVMEGLKVLQPGVESGPYESLRTNIKNRLDEDPPQKHEVTRVLDKIAEISYTDTSSTPVIDWQREDNIITITDPFFAFFLKWSN